VNILMATIDFRYVFGGYVGMFNLALRLRREGFRVRIVLLEQTNFDLASWRKKIKKYPGVTRLFDEVEVIHRFDRGDPVRASPNDQFVATNAWGAHIAHHANMQLGKDRFMFMVQEYEPFFVPMNTVGAVFQQSYRFPQFDLFSTYQLRDYFGQQKIGIFSQPDSDANHAVFRNAIQQFAPTEADFQHDERRVLFYARPEEHAARNLYELGIKALMELAGSPEFDATTWKFFGIGSLGEARRVRLTGNVSIALIPKTDLERYTRILPRYDVGLSLMLTPHPSLVPIEMAAAGMWTVTNTFANKTAETLTDISTNIIAVEPTLDGVVAGLKTAILRVNRFDLRLAGAKVNWPTDWGEAFGSESIRKIVQFLS